MEEVASTEGFGWWNVCEIESRKPEWVIEDILPKGFGFLAGAPKANNSPHGGKTVLSLSMLLSIVSSQQFLEREVCIDGPVLIVNLDQAPHEVSAKIKSMFHKQELRGMMISKAYTLAFPKDLDRLLMDIQALKPSVLVIDPLLRCTGGQDIKDASKTGPIIDRLKKIQRETGVTILVVHHSVKNPDRDKESTSSWLSGSVDLDSAWDFCLCLEWKRKEDVMHLRCFLRNVGREDIHYRAIKNEEDIIIGLELVDEESPSVREKKIKQSLEVEGRATVKELSAKTDIPESTVKRILLNGKSIFRRAGLDGKAALWESAVQQKPTCATGLLSDKAIGA